MARVPVPIEIRFRSEEAETWTAESLAAYLRAVDLVTLAAIAVDDSDQAVDDDRDFWRSWNSMTLPPAPLVKVKGKRQRSKGAPPRPPSLDLEPRSAPSLRVESIGVGSIELVTIIYAVGGPVAIGAAVRSLLSNGPDWIERWSRLVGRIRVGRALDREELVRVLRRIEGYAELSDSDGSAVEELTDRWNETDVVEQRVRHARARVLHHTPDLSVSAVERPSRPPTAEAE